jgi:hypothetical protein
LFEEVLLERIITNKNNTVSMLTTYSNIIGGRIMSRKISEKFFWSINVTGFIMPKLIKMPATMPVECN